MAQEFLAQSARAAGDENTMWQSTWSMVASVNTRVASSLPAIDPALLDIDLHDLWHRYWHGAINTYPDSPKLDRLALQIIQTREQGVLNHQDQGTTTEVTASNGRRLWTDLPFLAEDMTAHWTKNCASLSSLQRLAGAQFLALLATAGGAADDPLCGIALVVLREALEQPRLLGRLGPVNEDPSRRMADLTIAELLPAANAWLFTAGYKLVQLSDREWEGCDAEVGGFGELVGFVLGLCCGLLLTIIHSVQVTPGRSTWELPRHVGFSPQRWVWWLRRLDEIAATVLEDDDEQREAGRCMRAFLEGMMDNMLHIAAQTNGPVAQAAKQAAGLVRHQPRVMLLGPARVD